MITSGRSARSGPDRPLPSTGDQDDGSRLRGRPALALRF
ncbi:hypothetical protein ATKI12_6455 [Kitasatospora sp. Ki12]